MGLFKNKKKGIAPHTWYPEILQWKQGDEINVWNIAQAIAVGWKVDWGTYKPVSYTHLRVHDTQAKLVCRRRLGRK